MHRLFVDDNHPPRADPVVTNQFKNIDKLIIRGIKDFLAQRKCFTNVIALPSRIEAPEDPAGHGKRAQSYPPTASSYKD